MLNKCRLCLNAEIGSDLISLDNNILIKEKLQSCVPEIDINLLKNSLICSPCSITLDNAFQFKCRCIKSEEHIRQYLESTLNTPVIVKEKSSLTTNSAEAEDVDNCVINHENNHRLENEGILESVLLVEDATLPHNSHWDHLTPSHCPPKDEVNIKSFIVCKSENTRETDPLLLTSDAPSETELKFIPEYDEEVDVKPKLPSKVQADNGKLPSVPNCRVVLTRYDENQSKKEVPNNTTFVCNICSKSFTRRRGLKLHNRLHTDPFVCSVCNAKFATKDNLTRHSLTHTGEKPFSCDFCDFKFTAKLSLQEHVRTRHTGEKPFACEFCDYQTGRKSLLMTHLQIHIGKKPFQCNACDYKSSRMSEFREHIRLHTGEKPYSCEVCDAKFAQRSHLQRHNRTHIVKKKRHVCKLCSVGFVKKSNLDRHMLIHTGKKPFTCSECGNKFALKQHLNKHMQIHKGEQLFACMHCSYKTAWKPCLIRHLGIHTKRKSSQRTKLLKHTKPHTREKSFVCEFCKAKFFKKSNLDQHILIHRDTNEHDSKVQLIVKEEHLQQEICS